MNSLQQLNAWSAQLVEYEDLRPSGVTIDRDTPTDQSLSFNENQSHTLPVGLIVTDIQNSEVADLTYTIDLSSITGDSNIDWGTLPAALTATEPTANVFVLEGFQLASQWVEFSQPTIQIPFGVFGELSYTASISYVVNNVTPVTRSWTVDLTVAEVEYLSSPALTRFYSNTTVNPSNPQILVDTGEFDPVWTMVVVPNPVTPVQSLTYAEFGSVSYNPDSRVLVATGNKAQVNSVLNSLSVVFNNEDVSTNLFYTLSNHLTSTVDQVVGVFRNQNLRAAINSTASVYMDTFGATLRTRVAMGLTPEFFDRLRTDSFYSRFTNTIVAPRIGNFDFNPIWTVTVTPSTALAVSNIAGAGTGGTVSYNPLTGVYTVTGNRTQVNSYLDTLTVTVPNYEQNFALTYRVTNDQNALEGVYVQQLTWIEEVENYTDARYYLTNGVNNPLTYFNNLRLVDTTVDRPSVIATAVGDVYISTSSENIGQNADFAASPARIEFDRLVVPQSGNFTIEFWTRFSSLSTAKRFISSRNLSNTGLSHYSLNWSSTDGFTFSVTGLTLTSGTSGINTNTWYPVAVVRSGNNFRLYVNGVLRSQGTASPVFADQITRLGSAGPGDTSSTFRMDELRISNTARYSSNYTPSTTAFQNDANTLALFHMDGENSSQEFLDDITNSIFRLRVTASAGDWGTPGQTVLDWSGTRDYINSQIDSAVYYPVPNSTANQTLRIEYWCNGVSRIDYTTSFNRFAQAVDLTRYTFTTPGSGVWTPSRAQLLYNDLDVLIIGGGGSASRESNFNRGPSGGGAGAVIQINRYLQDKSSYNYTVGSRGVTPFGMPANGNPGSASVFDGITAAGGAGGIAASGFSTVGSGGVSGSGQVGGSGLFDQNFGSHSGGGGGGSTGAGSNASALGYPTIRGGAGGAGFSSDISGSVITYAAGGHGQNNNGQTSGDPAPNTSAGSGGSWSGAGSPPEAGAGINGAVILKSYTRTPRTPITITVQGSPTRNTSVKQFGVSSLDTTTTDTTTMLTAGTSVFALETNDFTIEAWVRITQDFSTTDATVWSFMANSTDSVNMRLTVGSTQNRFIFRAAGANRITSDADWALDTWYHVAIVRRNSVTRMYVDGVAQSTTYTDVNNYPARNMNIARVGYTSVRALPGQIDELRVSDTARYTSNFSTPTAAFQNDSRTLLLMHMDANGFPDDNS